MDNSFQYLDHLYANQAVIGENDKGGVGQQGRDAFSAGYYLGHDGSYQRCAENYLEAMTSVSDV